MAFFDPPSKSWGLLSILYVFSGPQSQRAQERSLDEQQWKLYGKLHV